MIKLTDKHELLKQFKDNQLNKSLAMFEWSNLPDTLPMVELEKMLQINGYAVIAEYQGKVYAFQGGFSGQDVYNQPTQVLVNNPALKNNTTYTINKDCVVIKNDDMKQGLVKTYEYYGQRLIENQITMLMTDYNLRMPFTISSSDDQTTQSAKDYLNKIIDGSLGVIGEQKLFKALSVTPTNSKQTATFADLYGYQQFIIAQLNNTIGLATNNNMKRERLTTNEIEVNKNASYPLVDNMLRNRKQAVEKINEMFDLDISVEYSSIWGSDNSNDGKVSDNEFDGTVSVNSGVTSDDKPVDGGDEQPTEIDKNVEPSPNATGKDEPSADNEPTQETRKDVKEDEIDEQNVDGADNDDNPDNEDKEPSNDEQNGDDDTTSDVADNEPTTGDDDNQSNNDDDKKGREKKWCILSTLKMVGRVSLPY